MASHLKSETNVGQFRPAMVAIPEFSDSELWVLRSTLRERYGQAVEIHLADTEVRLDPSRTEVTECPAVFWKEREASFIICKLGENRFKNQFFYGPHEHYGTGRNEYDDLAECVTTILQVQSDDEREREGASAGSAPEVHDD